MRPRFVPQSPLCSNNLTVPRPTTRPALLPKCKKSAHSCRVDKVAAREVLISPLHYKLTSLTLNLLKTQLLVQGPLLIYSLVALDFAGTSNMVSARRE